MSTSIRPVQAADSFQQLMAFTFPSYRDQLNSALTGDPNIIAFVAEVGHEIVGMLLASVYQEPAEPPESTLLSVFVATSHRRQGIGTALMTDFQREAKQRGVAVASAVYIDGKSTTGAFEGLVAKTRWEPPVQRMIAVKQHWHDALVAPHAWCRDIPRPNGVTILPWSQVTSAQRDAIRVWQQTESEIPHYLFPDEVERNAALHLGTSVGLSIEGNILGWVLTHPLEDRVLRFTASYVKRSLQRRAYLLNLLHASISQMEPLGFDYGIWTVPIQDARMYQFASRRIAPHSEYCRQSKLVRLVLNQ
jgi:GNAT superfamily N-acetyltransferase